MVANDAAQHANHHLNRVDYKTSVLSVLAVVIADGTCSFFCGMKEP